MSSTELCKNWIISIIIMLLLKRDISSKHSSLLLSSLTQSAVGTCMILLSVFSSLTISVHDQAFFNSTSLIIPNATWDLTASTGITFRTCYDSGNLMSMNVSSTSSSSSTSLPTSNSQELTLLLHNSSVVFVWHINGQSGNAYVGNNISNNRWYTVTLKKLLNSLQFSVSQGSDLILGSVVVANTTYNSLLLDKRLNGDLKIGQGFFGCMYSGPGVNFSALGLTAENIVWDYCPLSTVNGCANVGLGADDCYTIPCKNGATCLDGVNNYTCVCPRNFNGTRCENDLAEMYGCQIQLCMNHGNCTDKPGMTPRFLCTCPPGFTGAICETAIDLCRTNPCEQGTCNTLPNSYSCNCTGTGYRGTNCTEDIDECSNRTACGGYTCYNHPGGFSCVCPQGYDGPLCKELDECSSSPCKNGASCTDQVNNFTCSCVPGYTGHTCNDDINECDSNPCAAFPNMRCLNLQNNYSCVCLEGYSGNPCSDVNECLMNVCRNNASCTNTLGGYNCSCLPGFRGKNCSVVISACEPNPCSNNGTCSGGVTNYTCHCLPGFAGTNCTDNIDECLNNSCQNHATCRDQVNSYKCDCLPGWTGDHCELDIDECKSSPCLFGGHCHNNLNSYNCTCITGYEGFNCDINIDECNKTQPCKNGGECFDGVNDYSCNCTSNWMGKNCSEEYNACSFKPCLNEANCTTNPPQHNYTCSCLSGFTDFNCKTNIDDCVGVNCPEYQKCYDGINSHYCRCPEGYTGSSCETEVNACLTAPCQNNGTCTNNGRGNYTCTCPHRYIDLNLSSGQKARFLTGYNGSNCENDINECDYNNPPICQAQGKCDNTPPGSFTCYCKSGSTFNTGTLCEQIRSYCNIRPPEQACQNGGTCVDVDIYLGYKCNCVPGFEGEFCETNIDECDSSPCQYGGSCNDLINSYVCICLEGLTGQNCEKDIDDCERNPCLNGGKCIDHINSFSCNCSGTGFNGTTCENNLDDCIQHQCQNGGTCVDGINDYSCNCLPGYTGRLCNVDIPECTPNPCAYNSKCLENSNTSLYDKGDSNFVNFTYEKAAGYLCICVPVVKGKNCTEDVDECLSGPCQHNGTCINIINAGFSCSCSSGYKGTNCEKEIDECQEYKPCKNGGSCIDKLADYECVCPTPVTGRNNYGGKNCTTYLRGCDGSNNKCRNGNCIPKFIKNEHSSICICYPGYTGAYCSESTDMSFRLSWNDYIKSQLNTTELNLNLRFQTTVSNAALFIWKLSPITYISIELTNGRVNFKYRAGHNIQSCTLTTLSTVNNAEYHQLNLTVVNNITLTLPLDYCSGSDCNSQSCQASWSLFGNQLPSVSQVYIGSGNILELQNETFAESFVGCMEDVLINGDLHYPGKQIGQYFGVSPGCSRIPQCEKDSCNHNGICEDQWDRHVCLCRRPFYGDECENEYEAATFGIIQESFVTYRTFFGNKDNWTISFFIITRQEEGFIVYFGNEFQNTRKLSYVGLYIKNGRLVGDFYKCEYTKHFDTPQQISNGQKYLVSFEIKEKSFKVMLDSEPVFQDNNVNSSSGLCQSNLGFTVSLAVFGHGNITTNFRKKRNVDFLNMSEVSVIWSVRHQRLRRQTNIPVLMSYQYMPSFQGVIQDVEVNDYKMSFNNSELLPPIASNIILGAHSTKNICNDSQCEHGGNCTNIFYNDFNCSCPPGFTGKNCSTLDHCFFGTCPAESTCQNLLEGYECLSTASLNTDNSIITYTISGDTPDPVLTFDFRTRGLYGLIFLLRKGDYYFKVRVANGKLEMNWKLTSNFSVTRVTRQNKQVNDGLWYQAKFEIINGTSLKLQVMQENNFVDDTDIVKLDAVNFSVEDMLRNGEIILGGSNGAIFSFQWEAGYKGCLRNVRMGGVLMPFYRDEMFINNTARNKFLVQHMEMISHNCVGKNACAGHSCLNGGICVDLWNAYKCQCPVGLEGPLCETNPDNCASQMCFNGGVCVDGLGTFTCTCPRGFSGNKCQEDLDFCNATNTTLCENNSTCIDLVSDFKCNCTNLDYTGWYCNVTTHQKCSADLCQNGGTCNDITKAPENASSFNCSCRPGYQGPLCEKPINYCSKGVMCENNGTCINKPDNQSFMCICNATLDYEGFNCSEKIDNCAVISCNNGFCVDGVNNYTCSCSDGYTGPTCNTKITDICQQKSPCQHGNCTDGLCYCTGSGWSGSGCDQEINECNSTEPGCLHDGNCTNLEGNFTCNCSLGYEGHRCSTPNCSNLCKYGKCHTNDTNWWCVCDDYVEGLLCEKTGLCYEKPCNQNNTSTCIQNTTINNYTCICTEGWEGINCTEDINECDRKTDNCTNGNCSNTNGNYTCKCYPGYTGWLCNIDIDECSSSPCQHGGVCSSLINNYTCNCSLTGYQEPTCSIDIDECASNLSVCNNGECINLNGTFECNCTDKYLGEYCKFNNPCYNYTKCLNGGVCQYNRTQSGSYEAQCRCHVDYDGVNCEKKQGQSGSKGPDIGVIIGPIVGGVVLIILVIVIIAFVMTARSKRATRGAYSPSQQETSGSRVEMDNVLKKPPEERLI